MEQVVQDLTRRNAMLEREVESLKKQLEKERKHAERQIIELRSQLSVAKAMGGYYGGGC